MRIAYRIPYRIPALYTLISKSHSRGIAFYNRVPYRVLQKVLYNVYVRYIREKDGIMQGTLEGVL